METRAVLGDMRFAQVVVRSPLGRSAGHPDLLQTFDYSIPPHLQDRLVPGQLIWVPFGRRQVPGIIMSLSRASAIDEVKDILDLIDSHPVLTPYQIDLAHWISQRYLSPLHLAAWGMFPGGMSWKAETSLELADAVDPATPLDPQQQQILDLLHQNGPLPTEQLARQLKLTKWRPLLERMVRKGWVRKRLRTRGPQVKPKTERVVRLLHTPGEEAIAALSRAPRQQAVLDYLRQRAQEGSDPSSLVIPLSELRDQVGASKSVVDRLVERGILAWDQREVRRDPLAGRQFVTTTPPRFTPDQEAAWQRLAATLESDTSKTFLLHGVTGSGKTEIYLRALAQVLEHGGQGIILVPEISLTPQTIRRFAARFPGRLAVLHSKLSEGERFDEWRRIREGRADVVIGPRSAIFAPLPRLRLIVLDEEHEWTYKQQTSPHYHARDVAVKLAELTGALVVLGSATPDLESYHRARRGEYTLLQLPQRIMAHRRAVEEQRQKHHISAEQDRVKPLGAGSTDARYMELPPVDIVDMRAELRAGNRSIFSRAMQKAVQATLDADEQVILFLNRRGTATFVMCRDCGHVIKCPRCEVPLTFHRISASLGQGADKDLLICHHCNHHAPVPKSCPQCQGRRIKYFGTGTQKVEQMVHTLFPHARLLRWDRDVTGRRGAHERILSTFADHRADVLIGTQMVAKGLDLPFVTLVGVITADTALHLPDFRASERTFQLLAQVAGRAGRSILGGKVIIQTYAPQHYCIQAASGHDYESFYEQEIAFRRQQVYPPFSRLVKLLFTHTNAAKCKEAAHTLWQRLGNRIARLGMPNVDLIGPAPCFIGRLRGRYRWQIIVRGPDPTRLLVGLRLPLGWRVDVDPVSLL